MNLRADPRHRINAGTKLLLGAALVAPSFSFVALPPVLPDIAAHFGGGVAGRNIAQAVEVLPFLGLACGGLLAGWCIRRIGTSRSIALAGMALFLSGLGGFAGDYLPLLLASSATLGLAAALATSALADLTGAVVAEARRTRLLGIQVALSDLCTLAGGAAAAVLAHRVGWHGPFLIFTTFGLFLLSCVFAARLKPDSAATAPGGLLHMAVLGWPVYLAAGFVFLLIATQATQLPFYLEQLGYATPAQRAIVTTFALFSAMCGSISFALVQGRLRPWIIQGASAFLAAGGLIGLASWNGDLAPGLVFTFVTGAGIGLTVPVLFAASLRRAPPGMRGHSIGLLNVAIFLGSFLSPIVFTPIAQAAGYEGLYLFMAAAVAIVGLLRGRWLYAGRPAASNPIHSTIKAAADG